jgi:hypothetical protein
LKAIAWKPHINSIAEAAQIVQVAVLNADACRAAALA